MAKVETTTAFPCGKDLARGLLLIAKKPGVWYCGDLIQRKLALMVYFFQRGKKRLASTDNPGLVFVLQKWLTKS